MLPILAPSPPPPFANVVQFGADPTGTNDSTAAFLAAEASLPANGGVVFMPPGTYKVGRGGTGIIFTKPGTSLWGSGSGGGQGAPNDISVIDATALGVNHAAGLLPVIGSSSAQNLRGCSFRNFKIKMALGTPANYSDQVGVTGIRLPGGCTQIVLDNVVITGGDHSYMQFGDQLCSIFGCLFQNPTGPAWWLNGCAFCNSYGSSFSNGWCNVKMTDSGSVPCVDCNVYGGNIDESGSWSVWIEDADHCSVNGCNIWSGANGGVLIAGTGTTPTYGVRNFRLTGCRIQPFQTNINTPGTINIGSMAVGTRLVDVDTNPQGGATDIVDVGAGTIYQNVNGRSTAAIVPPSCTATISGAIAVGDMLPFVFTNANCTSFPRTVTYTVVAGDTTLTLLAQHAAAAINADQVCINNGVVATPSGATIILSQPGMNARNTTVSCTPTHGGGGTEAVAFTNAGAFKSGVPTAATFQTAPWVTYSSWGASVPVKPTGTGTLPTGLPMDVLMNAETDTLYFLGAGGTVRAITSA